MTLNPITAAIRAHFPRRLWLDLETKSRNPIINGHYPYAEDSSCLLATYALDDGPVQAWDAASGAPMPADLRAALLDESVEIVAWNAGFDRTQIAAWIQRFPGQGWPASIASPRRWFDAMTAARMMGLPGSLDAACKVLQLPEAYAKKDGDALIKKFCVPTKSNKFVSPAEAPADWQRFIEYAKFDITAMREVMKRIPNLLVGKARETYYYTEVMNDRGLPIDRGLALKAVVQAADFKDRYKAHARDLTGNDEFNISSQKALLEFLQSYGITLENARSATLEKFLDSADAELLPLTVREVLSTRLKSNKSSVTKYSAMLKRSNRDDRIRGVITMYGANRTGRDSSRGFQAQNLARPVLLGDKLSMDEACEIVKRGMAELYFDDPLQLLSDTVRGTITASSEKLLAIADLSNIEGRCCPWLANEAGKLEYFRDFDAGRIKYDNYVMAYSKSFRVHPEQVTKQGRQVGKVSELACFGADTRVLTDNGVKRIIDVTVNDKLWDGVEWVSHQGVICKGQREVLNLMGVTVTADHLILTGDHWVEAEALVSSKQLRGLALAKGSENLPSSVTRWTDPTQSAPAECSPFNAPAGVNHTTQSCTVSFAAKLLDASRVVLKPLLATLKNSGSTQSIAPMMNIVGGYSIGWPPAKAAAITPMTLVTPITEGEAYIFTGRGKKTKPTSYGTSSLWTGGMTPNWNSTASMSTAGMNRAICGSSVNAPISRTGGRLERCRTTSLNLKPVYDILNSGSRNRFTVITDEGPIIAHNCQYGGSVGAYITFATAFRLDIDELGRGIARNADTSLVGECMEMYEWAHNNDITYGLEREVWAGLMAGVKAWRRSHPFIEKSWAKAEDAFRNAIKNPGVWFEAAHQTHAINQGGWIFVRLPSGRNLIYPNAHETEAKGRRKKGLAFYGVSPFNKKWGLIYTHGARLIENFTQAMACDCLFEHLPEVEQTGFEVIMRVHDEVVAEVSEYGDLSGEVLAQIIGRPHEWCADLPMAAKGETTRRYDK